MDDLSRNWRLALRDSVSSASLTPAPTGMASQLNSTSGPVPDAPEPLNYNIIHERSYSDSSGIQTSSSSGLPSDCSTDNLRPMLSGCMFLDENDGSLHYSEGWSFSTSDPNGLLYTLHFTRTPGSSVSLTFNASNIIVFGLLPSGSSPPQASYSIDGAILTSPHMAATTACIPNQQLFNSGNLSTGFHNLTIDVTVASDNQPYILDYLWLCGTGAAISNSTSTTTSTTTVEARGTVTLTRDMIITAAVLGMVVLVLAIAFYVSLSRLRKNTRQLVSLSGRRDPFFRVDDVHTVTPFPGPPQAPSPRLSQVRAKPDSDDDPATISSLEEGSGWSDVSNVATWYPGSAAGVYTDEHSSSLAPPPSTTSTVLARRFEKATRFRSLIPFRGSLPLSRQSLPSMTGGGTRVMDELPPPYAAR